MPNETGNHLQEMSIMIKVSVLYPHTPGCRFDIDDYCNRHMAMVKTLLGEACKGIAVDRGVAGDAAGSPPLYVAVGHLYFESVDAFRAAFAPHEAAIVADIGNYTDIAPLLQVSEVVVNARGREADALHVHLNPA
jgi:uncharacterized protein (TIGR02118 family)